MVIDTYLPTSPGCVSRRRIFVPGLKLRSSERTWIVLAVRSVRRSVQRNLTQLASSLVPFGVFTVKRVNVVRVRVNVPAVRTTGKGLMNLGPEFGCVDGGGGDGFWNGVPDGVAVAAGVAVGVAVGTGVGSW